MTFPVRWFFWLPTAAMFAASSFMVFNAGLGMDNGDAARAFVSLALAVVFFMAAISGFLVARGKTL